MKGHENIFFLPHSSHRSWGKNGERLREKKMHAMRGSKDLYSRILGGIGKGSEGQTQLQYSSASFLCIQETYFISTISQFESD
jgi:hypothetical protein